MRLNIWQSGGSPTGSLLKRTFASKANVPFSKRTFPFQMERSLFKWNVPFSNGTFPFQMERSLPKGNVRFSTGTFASQRGRSLPKGTVRFPKGTFAFQKERSLFKGNVACYYKRSKSLWKVSLFAMPFQPAHDGLHAEIHAITATEASARCFLMTRAILKPSMICSCATPMDMVTCSSSKSADLFIWKCPSCKKYKTIRTDSVLAGTKLSFQQFSSVIFYFSVRSLTNVEVAALTGISDKAVGDWRCILSNAVANWFLNNSTPLGGPGKIVEVDEAKFGKRKYNKGAYREGMWVLGGVDRETGNCFLVPCPGNRRTAAVLIPVIERWILPGSIVYTDEWASYGGLTARGYTHDWVNHSIQFVDPVTGVHTNTQEGLWHHVKRRMSGSRLPNILLFLFEIVIKMKYVTSRVRILYVCEM